MDTPVRTDEDIDAALRSLEQSKGADRTALVNLLLGQAQGFAEFVIEQIPTNKLSPIKLVELLAAVSPALSEQAFFGRDPVTAIVTAFERGFERHSAQLSRDEGVGGSPMLQEASVQWVHSASRSIALLAEAGESQRCHLGTPKLLAALVAALQAMALDAAAPVASALSKLNAGASHEPSLASWHCGAVAAAVAVLAEAEPRTHNPLVASLWSLISLSLVHLRGSLPDGPALCWEAGNLVLESPEAMPRLVDALLGAFKGQGAQQVPTSAVGAAMVTQAMLEAFVPSAPMSHDRERVVRRFLLAPSSSSVCCLQVWQSHPLTAHPALPNPSLPSCLCVPGDASDRPRLPGRTLQRRQGSRSSDMQLR